MRYLLYLTLSGVDHFHCRNIEVTGGHRNSGTNNWKCQEAPYVKKGKYLYKNSDGIVAFRNYDGCPMWLITEAQSANDTFIV